MISFELNQARLKGGRRMKGADVKRALQAVAAGLRRKKGTAVSIAFVSEGEMKRLNKEWRGKDAITDVLSFGDGEGNGEVILNYEQAARQAKEMGHSTRDEALFLVVHGVLHLHGFDHERPSDAKEMFSLQTRILKRLDIDPRLSPEALPV